MPYVLLIILLFVMTILALFAVFTLYAIFSNAPYVPTHQKLVEKMLDMAEVKHDDVVVDLGAGDGRIVMAAGGRGATTFGYEINPILVVIGNWRLRRLRHSERSEQSLWSRGSLVPAQDDKRLRIFWRNFWNQDLSEAAVITIFGFPNMMGRLEKKLQKELKPGSRVVSHAFQFPNWQPVRKEDGLWLYFVE